MTTFENKPKQDKDGNWFTIVTVKENGKFLWYQSTDIKRLNRKDALQDGQNLIKEVEQFNK